MIKNNFISMQKGFLALMSAALLFSCSSIEPFEMEGNDVLFSSGISNLEDCRIHCISDENPESYQKLTGRDVVSWGGSEADKHTKTINYVAYNTENTFVIVATWNRVSPGGGTHTANYAVTFEGATQEKSAANGSTSTFIFDLPEGWSGCDKVTFKIVETSGDKAHNITQDYFLYSVCPDCEAGFSYVDNRNGTYTFTYVSEEDIKGANLVFTFPQATVLSGLNGWSTSGSTKQMTQDIKGCTPYVWTVGLASDCSGQGQTSANLWTDFKVNDLSKKGDLKNIEKDCNM